MLRRQACDRCYRRKQKCDRVLPICANCQSAAAVCEQRQISVAVDGSDGNGPEHIEIPSGEGYVASLKRRIAQLEDHGRNKRPRLHNQRQSGQHGASEDSSLREALREFRHLVLSSMAADGSSDASRSSNSRSMGTWKVFDAAIIACRSGIDDNEDYEEIRKISEQNTAVKLGPKLTHSLLEKYIKLILHQYAFCDPASLWRDYELVLEHDSAGTTQEIAASAPHRVAILYMALATSAFSSDSITTRAYAIKLHTAASTIMQQSVARMSPLAAIRCIISCAICSLHASNMSSAWSLIGIAVSKAVSLGLHRLKTEDSNLSTEMMVEDRNAQARIFWVVYILDRTISCALSRPFAIEERDVATVSPTENGDDLMLLPMAEEVKFARLLSRLREQRSRDLSYYAGEYYHFREPSASAASNESANESPKREQALRHRCRAMTVIFTNQATASPAQSTELFQELAKEMMAISQEWLQAVFEQSDNDSIMLSVCDGYDMVQAALVCCFISKHARGTELDIPLRTSLSSILGTVIAILSMLIARYASMKSLRKILIVCQTMSISSFDPRSQGNNLPLTDWADVPLPMVHLLEHILGD